MGKTLKELDSIRTASLPGSIVREIEACAAPWVADLDVRREISGDRRGLGSEVAIGTQWTAQHCGEALGIAGLGQHPHA